MDRWISIKDEMPKADETVLVSSETDPKEIVEIADYNCFENKFLEHNDVYEVEFYDGSNTTHWMRFPNHPSKLEKHARRKILSRYGVSGNPAGR